MPRPNPTGSAIQQALQGFSGTFFPLAQRQIQQQEEMTMRAAMQQRELQNAMTLAKEKQRLESEQQSELYKVLIGGQGGDEYEATGISGGNITYGKKKQQIPGSALRKVLPEDVAIEAEKIENPDMQAKYIDDYRANQGLIIRQEAEKSRADRNALLDSLKQTQDPKEKAQTIKLLQDNIRRAEIAVPAWKSAGELFGMEEDRNVQAAKQELEKYMKESTRIGGDKTKEEAKVKPKQADAYPIGTIKKYQGKTYKFKGGANTKENWEAQ